MILNIIKSTKIMTLLKTFCSKNEEDTKTKVPFQEYYIINKPWERSKDSRRGVETVFMKHISNMLYAQNKS